MDKEKRFTKLDAARAKLENLRLNLSAFSDAANRRDGEDWFVAIALTMLSIAIEQVIDHIEASESEAEGKKEGT